jgi:protein-tyrosine phosphatase
MEKISLFYNYLYNGAHYYLASSYNSYSNYFDNENLIIDRDNFKLWIGNIHTSQNIDFIKKNNIQFILNCTADIPQIYQEMDLQDEDLEHLEEKVKFNHVSVNDSLLQEDFDLMEIHFKTILHKIYKAYRKNQNVLIFCRGGKQRSAIITSAFLYQYRHLFQKELRGTKSKNIFSYLLKKRPQIFTYGFRFNFISSFNNYFTKTLKLNTSQEKSAYVTIE